MDISVRSIFEEVRGANVKLLYIFTLSCFSTLYSMVFLHFIVLYPPHDISSSHDTASIHDTLSVPEHMFRSSVV